MSDREEILAFEAQLKIEKQQLFINNPEEYCITNGMTINNSGICADFRNKYLYKLNSANKILIPSYEEYSQALTFPEGITDFLNSKAQANTVQEINKIVQEANSYIKEGTLTEEQAELLKGKLEALCK